MDTAPDLIFVSLENWDDIWRRNQFICAAYARRFPQSKILFVGLPRNVSHHLRRGTLRQLREEATWTVADLPGITVTRPLKLFPNTLAAGRELNERGMRAHVRHAARRMRLDNPVLWLNPHDAVHTVGRMDERAVIYDITDDWTELSQSPARKVLVQAQDAALCRRADAVIVCSEKLFALKRGLARNLHLIPNGVDAEHYRCVLEDTGALPEETRAWRKPVLGYTGSIHPDRVDVDLIAELACALPQATLALVGPNMLPEAMRTRLQAQPNIIFTGSIPYARLPQIMRAFDVCIVPHRVTPFTESLNPIKLWEYLAAGKPIVSTDVAGFRDYPEHVAIAQNLEMFVRAAGAALHEADARKQARRVEARCHSWERRLDAILEALKQAETAAQGLSAQV